MLTKKRILLVILTLVLLTIVLILKDKSVLSISVSPKANETVTYTLVNQDSGDSTSFTSDKERVKRLVSRGNYTVYAQGEISGYFAIVTTSGFLRTTSVEGTLSSERSRQFVGNGAAPCIAYEQQVLYSFACNSSLNEVNRHEPATGSQPSYAFNAGLQSEAELDGIAYTKAGENIMLTGSVLVAEEVASSYNSVNRLVNGLNVTDPRELNNLITSFDYAITAHKDGFLIYTTDLSEAFYYSSLEAAPETIILPKPKNARNLPVGLRSNGESILTIYSNSVAEDEHGDEELTTELIVSNGTSDKRYEINTGVNDAALCGDKVCILKGNVLEVYTIGTELEFEYKLTGVNYLRAIDDRFYALTDLGVLRLDPANKSGTIDYSFGGYKSCGIDQVTSGYIVCLIDPKQNLASLFVDPTKEAANDNDKKLLKLHKNSAISQTSVYKNLLFITPEIGDVNLSETNNIGSYTEEQIAKGAKIVSDALTEAGIAKDDFTVVNTTDPY